MFQNIMTWVKPQPIVFEPDKWFTNMIEKLDRLKQTEIRIEKIRGELRIALHELQHQRDKYQAISEASNCGIIIHRDDEVIVVNAIMEKLLGYTEQQLIDNIQLLNKCYSDSDLEIVNQHKYSNSMEPYVVSIINKDGNSTRVRLVPKMVNFNGRGMCRAICATLYKEHNCA